MEYPVYIDGRKCGRLTVCVEGLMTVMRVKCDGVSEKPIRLRLYGAGTSALLGTLRPEGGGMTLCRRFSRSEMEKLPRGIEYASDAPRQGADGDTVWRRGKRGCLVSSGAIAIPADERRLGKVADKLHRIEGATYIIFERKL